MIPVFQTRTGTEELGNCLEACLASILEIPLSRIPDRRDYVGEAWPERVRAARARGKRAVGDLVLELDEWEAALNAWLADRGLAWLELDLGDEDLLELPAFAGYWIGSHRTEHDSSHAVVYLGREIVHNPQRGVLEGELLGRLAEATLLVALDVRKVGRFAGEMLPDIEAALA